MAYSLVLSYINNKYINELPEYLNVDKMVIKDNNYDMLIKKALNNNKINIAKTLLIKYGLENNKEIFNNNKNFYFYQTNMSILGYYIFLDNVSVVKQILEKANNKEEYVNNIEFIKSTINNDNIEIMQILIDNGFNIKMNNILHYAVKQNKKEIVEYLLKIGLDVNGFDSNKNASLHYAVQNENMEMIKLLLINGSIINIENSEGTTPIMLCNNVSILEFLINNAANLHKVNIKGESILEYAVKGGDLKLVEYLVEKYVDHRRLNNKGESILELSIYKIDLFKYLIEKLRYNEWEEKYCLFDYAVKNRLYRSIEMLVEYEDINKVNKKGRTPLIEAINLRDYSMVIYLLDNKADINQSDKIERPPSYYAIYSSFKIFKYIINNGADCNWIDPCNGWSLLDYCYIHKDRYMITYLEKQILKCRY